MTTHSNSPTSDELALEELDPTEYDAADAGISQDTYDALEDGDPIVYTPFDDEVAIGRYVDPASASVATGTDTLVSSMFLVGPDHIIEVLDE